MRMVRIVPMWYKLNFQKKEQKPFSSLQKIVSMLVISFEVTPEHQWVLIYCASEYILFRKKISKTYKLKTEKMIIEYLQTLG